MFPLNQLTIFVFNIHRISSKVTEEVSNIFSPFFLHISHCPSKWALQKSNIYLSLILQFKLETGKFPASFFKKPVACSKQYLNAREVMEVLALKPGEYLIVPSTYSPNETASFILTIYSKDEADI